MTVTLILIESKIASICGCGRFYSFSLLVTNEDEIGEMFVLLFFDSSIYIIARKKKVVAKNIYVNIISTVE